MKRKLMLFLMILIVGLCPIIFVACGGVTGENLSLSFSGDIEENVIYLTAGDEENSAKDLTVRINNWSEAVSRNLSFVSDSTSISISSPTYFKDGSAKVTVSAVHGGTAYITVTTEQFSKQATIKVVVKENLKDFSLKNGVSEIYYEKNSGNLNINLEDYFDFSPKTATEKTLLAYDGNECLTSGGITTISGLSADTSLTIVSPNLSEKSVNLLVKVLEKLESDEISLKKSTYNTSGNIEFVDIDSGSTITLLKNNNATNTSGKRVATESCFVKLVSNSLISNLEIKPVVQTKNGENWVENKYILVEEVLSGEIANNLAANEHLFKITYSGEDQMKVVFTFSLGGYTYSVRKELYVNVLDAPSNISINGESSSEFNYSIYTTSNSYVGKSLKFNIFPENSADYKAYLYFNQTSNEALVVKNSQGTLKNKTAALGGYKTTISNNETVFVSAVDNQEKNQTATLKVEFTFENINFEFEATLNFEIKKTPSAVKVIANENLNGESSDAYESLLQAYLDINGSGKRIDASASKIEYDGKNTLDFYVYGVVDGKLERGHSFTVKNNTSVVDYELGENGKITVFAKQVGIGSLTISFETGEKVSVKFQVVNSVSEFDVNFPTPTQNSNVIKLENEGELKVALLSNKKIYITRKIVGDYQNLKASCMFEGDEIVSLKDGNFEVKKDTNSFKSATISFKYSYIEDGEIKTENVSFTFKLLSLTKVSKFNISTNKASSNFTLYDFSSVGFYSQNLATAVLTLNIEPAELRNSLISNVSWLVNGTEISAENDEENILEYSYNDLFTIRYNKTTGVATVLCDTKNFDEGEIPERIILQAKITRTLEEMQIETLEKSVSFRIVKNIPIEKIESSVDEISIDQFNRKATVFLTTFPIDASNSNLDIKFIPNDIKNQNAVKVSKTAGGFDVELQEGVVSGSGIIRIIAVDSYTSSTDFKTYIDIPLIICDGTKEYPYIISSPAGLDTLIKTEFKKYYKVSGEIDFSKFSDWEMSTYVLTGHIIGVNNARLVNISVSNLESVTENNTVKYFAGLFKEIAEDASIENISIVGSFNLELTKPTENNGIEPTENNGIEPIVDECNIGLLAGKNSGIIKNVFVFLKESSVSAGGGYNVNLGGLFGQNCGTISTKISADFNYHKLVEIKKLTFTDNASPSQHILRIGGVAGYNNGSISRKTDEKIVEIENSQTTADVNITVISEEYKNNDLTKSYKSNVTNENEAIGAIFGYSAGTILNLKAVGQICAGKFDVENNTFDGHFNNVGGIVGYNSANINDCVSQVFVRGNQNVGGLVGSQVGGTLTLNKVQALELEKDGYTGLNSALVIGNQNVGGLVGYAGSQSESINKNTFISYVSKTFSDLTTKNAEYYGNVLGFGKSETSLCIIGRMVAVDDYSGSFSQNVAICDVNGNNISLQDESFSETNAFYGKLWCSELCERYILGYNETRVNVKYDDCNPFGMIAGDFGEISSLSKHTTKSATKSTIVAFNTLSELFATYMSSFEIPTDGTEYIPTISGDVLNAYTQFYNQAIQLYNSSLVSFTKDVSNDLTRSAIIGVNHPYTMAFGTDVSPELINFQTVIANLFGFSSKTDFMNYAQNLAYAYAEHRTNITNSLTANEALNNGCFYTTNGSFVFPIAVKNELSSTVLAYVILDTSGLVSVWVNDITAALWATNFNSSYHTSSIINNELYCKNILFVTRPNYVSASFLNTLCGSESYSLTEGTLEEFIEKIIDAQDNDEDKEKVSFIILPPTELTITLAEKGESNQLKPIKDGNAVDSENKNLVFFLYYHEKQNVEEQSKFDAKNTYKISDFINCSVNSNTPIVISSENENIVKIVNDQFVVVGTGVVKIVVSSEFTKTLKQEFYIYAVNYVSNFDMFEKADKSSQIFTNSSKTFDLYSSFMIYFRYLEKFNTENYVENSQIKVAIFEDGELLFAGKSSDLINFFGISYDAYQLSFREEATSKLIEFIPYFETIIDGKTYSTIFIEIAAPNKISIKNGSNSIVSTIKVEKQTRSITSNQTDASLMPIYKGVFDIFVNTEKTDEVLTINQFELIDGVYQQTDELNLEISLTKSDGKYSVETNKNFKIYVSLKNKNISSEKKFKVQIISSNDKKCELNITFKPQKPNNVDVYFYNLESKTTEEHFSYVSTNKIVPGVAGLFEFLIVPSYSDYDYIEISNLSSNAYNIIFENLYKREESVPSQYIEKTLNGFKIYKQTLENLDLNGRFSVRAVLDERTKDGEVVSFNVDVYDNNGAKVCETARYDFYAEHLPGVKFSVDGTSRTTDAERLKLALGKTYDLELNVKGFAQGSSLQFNNSTKTYTDGEIVFKFDQIDNLAELKKVDGKYKLVVNSEISFTNRELKITAYGEKITSNGIIRSAEFDFYIEVVHFIVKSSEISDLIVGFSNGVHRSAIGDEFTFEVGLNDDVLIYDKSNAAICSEVENFLQSLSKPQYFSIKDATGYYSGWQSFSNLSNAQARVRNDAMEFSIVDGKLVVKFKKLERLSSVSCLFMFKAYVYYNSDGIPTVSTSDANNQILLSQTDLKFEVTERTSLTNPYPIYSPEEFMNMVAGNYYILMNDITLPNNFTGISTLIGGFDGNNHNIILPASLTIENPSSNSTYNFALFTNVAEGTLISNVRILVNSTSVDLTAYENINFATLAVNNYGTITNCAVVGRNSNSRIEVLNLDSTDYSGAPTSYISAFVVNNYGAITNSRVEISIEGKGNVAGFVYENNGTIASSFVYGTVANKTTSTLSVTAGFVANNNYDALIFTSYITGDYEEKYLHQTNVKINTPFATCDEYSSSFKIISSNHRLATFVYSNAGKISNCYANIPVSSSAVRASGFVFSNESSGEISYSYSTSKMSNYNSGHTVFIGRTVEALLNRGKLIECFAVEDVILNLGNQTEGSYVDSQITFMNYKLGSNENILGLKVIRNKEQDGGISIEFEGTPKTYKTVQEQFAEASLFTKYALSNDASRTNAVWFFPASETQAEYRTTDGNSYVGYKKLVLNRPELVAPNILVYGHQTFVKQVYNNESGETIYVYDNPSNYGEISNPVLIYNVESLEDIANINGYEIGEGKYYRLISNIQYNSGTASSKLFRYYFIGNLEGNSFTISNYVIDSSEELKSAGFFAGLGTAVKNKGSIKNVNFAPRYINLPNANAVGAVAGTVYGANVINVSVDGFVNDYEGIVVLGKNLVGGIVGYATGNYIFNNLSSNISVNSTYRASLDKKDVTILFDDYNAKSVSFAGLIAGAVSGNGKIDYVYAEGNNVSIAECAGLVFGFAGENVVVSNIYVNKTQTLTVKADVYGGVVAAVSSARLNDIEIDNHGKDSFFTQSVYTPKAVGNIVGFMIGGQINSANVKAKTTLPSSIQIVGGAVGIMQTGTLNSVVITGDIVGGQHVGGLVGYAGVVNTNGFSKDTEFLPIAHSITINNSYLAGKLTSNSSKSEVSVGTVVGFTILSGSQTAVNNKIDSISNLNITITSSEVKKYDVAINNYSFERSTMAYGTVVAYYRVGTTSEIYYYNNNKYQINKFDKYYIVEPTIYPSTSNN